MSHDSKPEKHTNVYKKETTRRKSNRTSTVISVTSNVKDSFYWKIYWINTDTNCQENNTFILLKVLPLSLLSSTRMISLSRCPGVWLTTLWTERRITDRASFTKMKTTEIWGRSSGYVSCLHLWRDFKPVLKLSVMFVWAAVFSRRQDTRTDYVFTLPILLAKNWI